SAGRADADAPRPHLRRARAAAGGLRPLMRVLVAALLAVALPAGAASPPRFFIEGDGRLTIVNAHTDERAAARYRLADGTSDLAKLWQRLRALDCCGAGYYRKEGFLHVDVGRPRFWEATTSRVDENLSAGNARMFARTEFDRYAAGEQIAVTLHALTVPPIRVARVAKLLGDGGVQRDVRIEGDGESCLEAASTGAHFKVGEAPGIG